ncbi:MAG: hypothetical protein KPI85_06870 [cyanobacterium endosymbiont of Epithemia adnata isolate EadnSB Bon19]
MDISLSYIMFISLSHLRLVLDRTSRRWDRVAIIQHLKDKSFTGKLSVFLRKKLIQEKTIHKGCYLKRRWYPQAGEFYPCYSLVRGGAVRKSEKSTLVLEAFALKPCRVW